MPLRSSPLRLGSCPSWFIAARRHGCGGCGIAAAKWPCSAGLSAGLEGPELPGRLSAVVAIRLAIRVEASGSSDGRRPFRGVSYGFPRVPGEGSRMRRSDEKPAACGDILDPFTAPREVHLRCRLFVCLARIAHIVRSPFFRQSGRGGTPPLPHHEACRLLALRGFRSLAPFVQRVLGFSSRRIRFGTLRPYLGTPLRRLLSPSFHGLPLCFSCPSSVRSKSLNGLRIQPFATLRQLLWPLLTSPRPSPVIADELVLSPRRRDLLE